ncbi:uncharacterized protein LOC134803044 [Cydia splendana]|uniref:uncharacterized protein LOC134803044 n=1 Tax=Cydia splendana TaxID=1100963 RepID=UPI00300CF6C2
MDFRKNILTTEVLPHAQSPSYQVKTTALRILGATKSFGDLSQFADVHTLEYELRGKVSHADAELILWCVEYRLPNSERLLQAAILFYDNLPQAVRKKIVVKGISKSPPELKRAAIQFLISQSCEDPVARVWRDLLEDDDVTVVMAGVRELADCLAAALQAVQEDETQELPPKLSSLLRLASLVPAAHALPLRACGPQLRGLVHHAATLNAAKALLAGASDLYKVSVEPYVELQASLVPPAHALPLRACGPQLRGLVHHAATRNAAKPLLASDLYKVSVEPYVELQASLVPPTHALPLRACGPQQRGLVHHAATLNAAKALLASDLYKVSVEPYVELQASLVQPAHALPLRAWGLQLRFD